MAKKARSSVGVVIPIYNPPISFVKTVNSVLTQSHPVERLVIIDSSPKPCEEVQFIAIPGGRTELEMIKILPREFDHGGTRNLGASKVKDLDFVVMLTQDAVMNEMCVKELVEFLEENRLAAAFARQIPRDCAENLESFEREFNYPAHSRITQGTPKNVIDTFFSNVCAIYRTGALEKVGGFPEQIICCEDMLTAARLLESGERLGYCATARVKHSHPISYGGTFRRYFDTGVMHAEWRRQIYLGQINGRGSAFVKGALKYCLTKAPGAVPAVIMSSAAKAVGYYLGKNYKALPLGIRRKVSGNKAFWMKSGGEHIASGC